MKKENLYITAALCLFAGFIIFLIGFAMMGFNFKNFDTEPVYTEKHYECSCEINKIVLNDGNSDINVVASPDDKIHLTYYENSKHSYVFSKYSSGMLTVDAQNKHNWTELFDISMSTLLFEIQVPENYAGNIYIEDAEGDITLKDCTLGGFHAESDGGFIHVTGGKISNALDLSSDNGEIGVYNVSVGGTVNLSSDAGRIYAQKLSASDIYAESDSGLITLSDISAELSVSVQSDNADVEFSGISFGNGITVISDSGNVSGTLLGADTDYLYNCKSDSGNCILPDVQSNPSGKQLNIRTDSGNITVSMAELVPVAETQE